MADSKLGILDFVAVVFYFTAVLAAGVYSMCRSNRGTVSGYFLAGRYMIWLPVGASLFASNIGSEHFIGLAGSGAASGVSVGAFELNACILLQLLGWVFLPVYIASGVCTLPEYMKKRFGGKRIRIFLATLSVFLYVLTKISVNLYSGALFIQQALNWNLYVSVFLLLCATAFCTVTGGLAAVIYTDTLQAFFMVIGSIILTIIAFIKVGGYEALYKGFLNAVPDDVYLHNGEDLWANSTLLTNGSSVIISANITALPENNDMCGYPPEHSWNMLRGPTDPDMPWPGFLLGQTPASIWYWCADQMMVQRTLAAKSLSHAQGGTLFAGFIKLLPVFIMVLPGMISRVLFTNEVACATPEVCLEVCGNANGCSNIAYPKLVLELMPAGLKGLMLSVMLAALMSDLTSIFNSASTLVTMDIYRYIRKKASVKELMIVGRAFVCVMVVISILWIPVIESMQGGQLYIYIQSICAYLAPPIASVYCMSILWPRANEKGAFWGLLGGIALGCVRLILETIYTAPKCGEPDHRPVYVSHVHYMYMALILFFTSALIVVVISLLTDPPTPEMLERTTFWTRHAKYDAVEMHGGIVHNNDANGGTAGKYTLNNGANGDAHDKYPPSNGVCNVKYSPTSNGNVKNEASIQFVQCEEYRGAGDFDSHRQLLKTDEQIPAKSEAREKSRARRAYDWFCGFDDSEEGLRKEEEQEERLRKITSLEQSKKEKILLNTMLVFLLGLAVFLYLFFSLGSDFGMYH